MIGLDQTATVYTADAGTGAFTTVAKSGLPCRLLTLNPQVEGLSRADMENARRLMWGPEYDMAEQGVQVEIDSERWNVQYGTTRAYRGLTGAVVYREIDVTRVQN